MADKPAFQHISKDGSARMVNVSEKTATRRAAVAEASVKVGTKVAAALAEEGGLAKGNVLETARLAGIMAAKKTAELIPMCHPLVLDSVEVEAELRKDNVYIRSEIISEGKTGVEMEAITAAAVAALTVYDMCKSADKGIEVVSVRLLEKSGGKSDYWVREEKNSG
jgi:cyclic pyranopterin phosphate synthase